MRVSEIRVNQIRVNQGLGVPYLKCYVIQQFNAFFDDFQLQVRIRYLLYIMSARRAQKVIYTSL